MCGHARRPVLPHLMVRDAHAAKSYVLCCQAKCEVAFASLRRKLCQRLKWVMQPFWAQQAPTPGRHPPRRAGLRKPRRPKNHWPRRLTHHQPRHRAQPARTAPTPRTPTGLDILGNPCPAALAKTSLGDGRHRCARPCLPMWAGTLVNL